MKSTILVATQFRWEYQIEIQIISKIFIYLLYITVWYFDFYLFVIYLFRKNVFFEAK